MTIRTTAVVKKVATKNPQQQGQYQTTEQHQKQQTMPQQKTGNAITQRRKKNRTTAQCCRNKKTCRNQKNKCRGYTTQTTPRLRSTKKEKKNKPRLQKQTMPRLCGNKKQTMPRCRGKTNHVAMLQQPKEPHHDAAEKQTINDAAAATKTCRDTAPS